MTSGQLCKQRYLITPRVFNFTIARSINRFVEETQSFGRRISEPGGTVINTATKRIHNRHWRRLGNRNYVQHLLTLPTHLNRETENSLAVNPRFSRVASTIVKLPSVGGTKSTESLLYGEIDLIIELMD